MSGITIEHISRSSMKVLFKGRRAVIGGELFLDPPGDWSGGCFELSTGSLTEWENGEPMTDSEQRELIENIAKEVVRTGQLKRIEIV